MLRVYDIRDPAAPRLVGRLLRPAGFAMTIESPAIAVAEDFLYLSLEEDGDHQIVIVDVAAFDGSAFVGTADRGLLEYAADPTMGAGAW